MATGNFFKHWPTMLLGVVVAVILLIAVFSYQLNQTESAVVTTFGSPAAVTDPGLHFRWPFPFQKIYKFDHRIRCILHFSNYRKFILKINRSKFTRFTAYKSCRSSNNIRR